MKLPILVLLSIIFITCSENINTPIFINVTTIKHHKDSSKMYPDMELRYHSTFQTVPYDLTGKNEIVEFPNYITNQYWKFPNDFQSGIDSIYRKDFDQSAFYLFQIWEYHSNKGDATFREYFTNGQIKQLTYYKASDKEERWYSDEDSNFLNIKHHPIKHGPFKTWFKNGQIQTEQQFQDGNLIGKNKTYYHHGSLKEQITVAKDLSTFALENWNKEGQKIMTIHFDLTINKFFLKKWNSEGELVADKERYLASDNQNNYKTIEVLKEYLYSKPNYCALKGVLKLPQETKRYDKEICMVFNPKEPVQTTYFLDYAPNADTMAYYKEVIQLFEDNPTKVYYQCFYPNGKLQMSINYDLAPNHKAKQAVENQVIQQAIILKGIAKYYYPNGNLKWERNYLDDFYFTEEKTYNENGELQSEVSKK